MKLVFGVIAFILLLAGCATNNYNKEIPIHSLSTGMSKQEVISKLGNPHRVVANEVVGGRNQQTWMYQQDKIIWLTGNAFLGGTTRNDQVIYLLGFVDDKLIGWRDNAYRPNTTPENTYELRSR
jgi:hypothetical protein